MAALGKIRSKGVFLLVIIGLGLFGFIAGDMFRSCEATGRASSNKAAVIYGEKTDIQEYQQYADQFAEFVKTQNPNMAEEQARQIAWNQYLNAKLIEHECEELGLTVTDKEMSDLINKGESPILQQFIPFGFTEDGQSFSPNIYKQIMSKKGNIPELGGQGEELYRRALFVEILMRQQLLQQKYQALFSLCVFSNPSEEKFAFEAKKNESDVQLAYIDYKSISDNDIKYTKADLEKKYEQYKKQFYNPAETRSGKFLLVTKEPSASDRQALISDLNKAAEDLRNTEEADTMVHFYGSKYFGLPVSKKAFNAQEQAKLDSIGIGSVVGPFKGVGADGSEVYSVMKLLSKSTLPDSVEYRVIGFGIDKNTTKAMAESKADSVLNALRAGENFDSIAKKYNNPAQKQWITTSAYERATNITKDDRTICQSVNTMAVNEIQKLSLTGGSWIIQVTDRRNMITKYDVALIQRKLDYSSDTSKEIDNKLNKFLADNKTREAIEKNAQKSGYQLYDITQISTENPNITVGGSAVPNSREALKWLFKADKDEVSKILNCGPNNDQKMVVILTDIYEKGYQTLDNPLVKSQIEELVKKDKKAEMLLAKFKDIKSVDAAREKGATVVDVNQVTLASPISNFPSESGLVGAIAKTAKGQFSSHPIVGEDGVYIFKVVDKRTLDLDETEKKNSAQRIISQYYQMLSSAFNDILNNAEVTDNRNLF